MHIELIGSTSAGKTTLAKKMVGAGTKNGIAISLSDDFMLDWVRLNWIQNEFLRRRLVEAIAFAMLLTCLPRHRKFLDFLILESRNLPGSWFYRINRIRNVARKIGIFEFITRNAGLEQVVLADNEGILQGIHNLFVHQHSQTDLGKIARYVELVRLPDVILYLRQEEQVLVARTLARGHGRVTGAPDQVVQFVKQAAMVFDEMAKLPILQGKLLIVNDQLNLQWHDEDSTAALLHQVIELVKTGV